MVRTTVLKSGCFVAVGALIVAAGVYATRSGDSGRLAHTEGDWAEPGAAAGFNVVLVTLDTVRADRLGCYGHRSAQTPSMDALAAGGVMFTDAVASAPLTLPSHVTIHTGLDIPHHGVRNNGEFHLAADHVTLAEILKENGYQTAAFVAAFVLDGRYGLNQGFDAYDDHFKPNPRKPGWGAELERPANEVTDAALAWLAGRAQSEAPFFMWVHYYDPHTEYEPPPEFARKLGGDLYDAEIAFVDSQLARIIAQLEQDGVRQRTLTIVLADHGEGLGEHDEMTHGHLIYESTMRVPLIFNAPACLGAGHVVSDRVAGCLDVTPTVLDLLGIAAETPMDGLSLLGPDSAIDRTIYMETMLPLLNHGWSSLHALRRHGDKYIDAPRREYYNLLDDPSEAINLIDDTPAALPALVDELETRQVAWEAMGAGVDARIAMDPEELKALEALGYVSSPIADEEYGTRDPKDMMKTWQGLINARGLADRGDLQAALDLIDTIQVFPRDLFALERRADIYTKMGRHTEAEKILREMLAIKPAVSTYIWLGQILIEKSQFEELTKILAQAETIEPDAGAILVLRGDVAAKKGQFDEALRLYDEAIRIDPKRSTSMAQSHAAKVREFIRQLEGQKP